MGDVHVAKEINDGCGNMLNMVKKITNVNFSIGTTSGFCKWTQYDIHCEHEHITDVLGAVTKLPLINWFDEFLV